jgi:hypothetical protein
MARTKATTSVIDSTFFLLFLMYVPADVLLSPIPQQNLVFFEILLRRKRKSANRFALSLICAIFALSSPTKGERCLD